MAYNRIQAAKLCSEPEYRLFLATLPGNIKDLTEKQLLDAVTRVRRLRDKYADLFRRQRLASRRRIGMKSGRSGKANERTDKKAKLFSEALNRIEARLVKMRAAEKRAKAKAARKPATMKRKTVKRGPKRSAKRKPRKAGAKGIAKAGPMSRRASRAKQKHRTHKSRAKAIQGHISARNKRNQVKRDKRN